MLMPRGSPLSWLSYPILCIEQLQPTAILCPPPMKAQLQLKRFGDECVGAVIDTPGNPVSGTSRKALAKNLLDPGWGKTLDISVCNSCS